MSRISVLVADDNPPIRKALVDALRMHFTVFRPAADGRQLVEAALARRPDVIVSDVWMPALNGIEAMRALRQMGRTVPFVMVSASPDIGLECLEAGAAAFVCKTEIERDLVAAVLAAFAGGTYPCPPPLAPGLPPAGFPGRPS